MRKKSDKFKEKTWFKRDYDLFTIMLTTPFNLLYSKKRPDLKGITTLKFNVAFPVSEFSNSKKRPDLKGITTNCNALNL